jgi:hypothetical protein
MPLKDATTPSLDALHAYSAGWRASIAGSARALPLFQRAVAIDPDFAIAHRGLTQFPRTGCCGRSVNRWIQG